MQRHPNTAVETPQLRPTARQDPMPAQPEEEVSPLLLAGVQPVAQAPQARASYSKGILPIWPGNSTVGNSSDKQAHTHSTTCAELSTGLTAPEAAANSVPKTRAG